MIAFKSRLNETTKTVSVLSDWYNAFERIDENGSMRLLLLMYSKLAILEVSALIEALYSQCIDNFIDENNLGYGKKRAVKEVSNYPTTYTPDNIFRALSHCLDEDKRQLELKVIQILDEKGLWEGFTFALSRVKEARNKHAHMQLKEFDSDIEHPKALAEKDIHSIVLGFQTIYEEILQGAVEYEELVC